jgi:protein-disulfide isomerase/uncharacterized membrane protein
VLQGSGAISSACSGNSFFDCGKTLGSSYGKVFGIPVSFFATLYFGWMIYHLLSNSLWLGGSNGQLSAKDCRRLFGLPYRVSLLAAGVCLVFLAIAFFVLHTICLYCLILDGLVASTLALSYLGMGRNLGRVERPCSTEPQRTIRDDRPYQIICELKRDLTSYGLHWYQQNWRRHSALVMLILFSAEMIVPSHLLWAMRSESSLQSVAVATSKTSELGKHQLKIVKFTDFECPACQYGAVQLEKFKEKYPGQVEVEIVNFPLSNKYNSSISGDLHPLAGLAAKVGIVMKGKGKFENYYKGMMNRSENLTEKKIDEVIKQLNEDVVAVKKQAESSEVAQILTRDIEKGRALGIHATPTLIVNGVKLTNGVDVAKLESMIFGTDAMQTVVDNAIKSMRVASVSLSGSESVATLASAGGGLISAAAGTTITAASCSQADVQNAVNQAQDGSTVLIPAGNCTWNAVVDLSAGATKAISIRGAGDYVTPWGSAGLTNIEVGPAVLTILSGWETTGHAVEISNIRFTYNQNSGNDTFAIITWNRQGGVSNLKHWIIHHNDFIVSGIPDNSRPKILLTGAIGGLIYRNKFVNNTSPPYITTNQVAVWQGITDDGSWWNSPSTFGSADTNGYSSLYVEDNYFDRFAVGTDRNTSSRMVWRFNEMHNASLGDHGYDSSTYGHRHSEVYNNTFICDHIQAMTAWYGQRGGTAMIFNNTFPSDSSLCNNSNGGVGNIGNIYLTQYKLIQAEEIGGWPGLYPDTYPMSHQVGWGWINGQNQTVGDSTKQDQPGGPGFQQALEPLYIFNNTNNSGKPLVNVATGYVGGGRAMAYSSSSKTTGNTLTATAYVSTGQHAFVAFTDLVGGSTPTISDDKGNTWTALQAGTNGGMRLSAWQAPITNGGRITVTITFDSSSAARAATLVTMRQLTASPVDKNPAVVVDNTSPYNGPSSGTLSQSDEVVLGYFALNGPTSQSGNTFVNDAIGATYPDQRAVSCGWCNGGVGFNGTTGGTDTSNVAVGVTYRYVSATAAVQPQIVNFNASRSGLAGTVTFKNNGTNPDLQVTDFIQPNREYYDQNASFNGTSGTGSGPRSARPTTCTPGVAYWSTDQGNWNNSGSGGQGVLDKCTATNTWTDGAYVPYTYPHPLVSGGITQPNPDSDADGLLDAWEVQHFGSISDPRAQPGLDPDNDGFTNLAEQTAGTSPIDSQSLLKITSVNFVGSSLNVQWTAAPSKIYQLDYSTTLTNWFPAVTVTNGSATTLQWTDDGSLTGGMPSGKTKRFYRVKLP